jgi:hypothetical protein
MPMKQKYSLKEKAGKSNVKEPKAETINNLLNFSKSLQILKHGQENISVHLN